MSFLKVSLFCAMLALVTRVESVKPSFDSFYSNYHIPTTSTSHPHPLDPLTENEIRSTAEIIRSHHPETEWVFHTIMLKEPPKSQLLNYFLLNRDVPQNSGIPRKSIATLRAKSSAQANTVVVNLSTGRVESWVGEPGFPRITSEESGYVREAVLKNATLVERIAKGGYPNMSLVQFSASTIPYTKDHPEWKDRRVVKVYVYGKNFDKDEAYVHPFDFWPVVDILTNEVVDIFELPAQSYIEDDGTDKRGVVIPRKEYNYDPELLGADFFRKDLKPVRTVQDGVSYKINGNEITWQKFKFRLGFNGREGLVLYWVSYKDGLEVRQFFYRIALSEMFVPYGDPRDGFVRRTPYDEGEYGMGYEANSLRAGEDCIGNVAFIDAVLHNEKGEPIKVPQVVCIREEDAGIGWKHTNPKTNQPYITRRQRLVLTFISTVGHYDYEFSIKFYQDATIEYSIKLMGILNANMMAIGANPAGHGTTVAEQLNGHFHQHFFCVRIDTEVDGNKNTVLMQDVYPGVGPTGSLTNKWGNGMIVNKTVFMTQGEARSNVNTDSARTWLVTSKWPIDTSEQFGGWKLVPNPTAKLMLQDDCPLMERGGFAKYNTWVTPYNDEQLYGAGFYVEGDGLVKWVENDPNANIANEDIVLWHIMAATHVPRQEEWVQMVPAEISFRLEPNNFFKENPAMDVPQVQKENPYRPR